MIKDMDGLIRKVYRSWKRRLKEEKAHPDIEDIASLLEGKLPLQEKQEIEKHIVLCSECAEAVSMGLTAKDSVGQTVPAEILDSAGERLGIKPAIDLEIVVRIKEKALELLRASGDILLGQELVPAALLRSRKISEFKDEVIIFKDFQEVRLEVRLENKSGKYFNLNIQARKKQSKEVVKDLRITLIQGETELESYLSDAGSVVFEHVLLGHYRIDVADLKGRLASVILEVKA